MSCPQPGEGASLSFSGLECRIADSGMDGSEVEKTKINLGIFLMKERTKSMPEVQMTSFSR